MLENPLKQYRLNLSSVQDLEAVYIALEALTTNVVPKGELLRAELVAMVSALDTYVHDIVREGLKHQYTNGTHNMHLNHIISTNQITSSTSLDNKIREINGYKSFQAPKKIKAAFEQIGILDIWAKVETALPNAEDTVSRIVDRRNLIAHESDINPANGLGEKWPITLPHVQQVVTNIDRIVNILDSIAQQEL
ncbi:HEPN domain-containing protein [Sulfuricurvum sp.]|uniref:HEPN domain-containing protein n=1 Tax=Sulfuricurvum sp. TaxID=2025608 RepID=UPI002633C05A|nr:HEPN domain-containing protein [Sulfuricurvum sp.]MDD2265464.1 HEPN domain-containing protein [Sulfuricurvum sp.]MDD2782879.1 HEPN domain-containing protein [Sulfuricurvum sp.]